MLDEIAYLEIAGQKFSDWESLTIQRSLSELADTFSFSSPFDPTRKDLLTSFRPFGYQKVVVKLDDELLFNGIIEQPTASTDSSGIKINVQGRSPAGALVDCNFEPPYQFDGQTWNAIAEKICVKFGIEVDKTINTGRIKIAKSGTGDNPGTFLLGLAKGEGYLVNSAPSGKMRLLKITKTKPVASIVEGVGSFISASMSANGTARFSRTKAIKSMGDWKPIEAVSNDNSIQIYRPRIITADGAPESIQKSADLARSESIASSCTVDVVITGWRTDSGHIWTPGDFITLQAPGAFIIRESQFVIDTVTMELTTSGRQTTLSVVLPEAYLGGVPIHYPWEDVFVIPEASRRFAS